MLFIKYFGKKNATLRIINLLYSLKSHSIGDILYAHQSSALFLKTRGGQNSFCMYFVQLFYNNLIFLQIIDMVPFYNLKILKEGVRTYKKKKKMVYSMMELYLLSGKVKQVSQKRF